MPSVLGLLGLVITPLRQPFYSFSARATQTGDKQLRRPFYSFSAMIIIIN